MKYWLRTDDKHTSKRLHKTTDSNQSNFNFIKPTVDALLLLGSRKYCTLNIRAADLNN